MPRRLVIASLAAFAASSFAVPQSAVSASGRAFRMPSRNIGCLYSTGFLRCDILSGLKPEPRGSCQLDRTGLSMSVRGRARPTCAGDTVLDARAPILRYGQTWRRGGFTCLSRVTGLRCTNRSGHGFFLSRQRWRVF